ncbi:peptidylprolyl isomerase [Candidatus Poribacteria bacterium]|nr:peptidylprolyl isomerase [Candidatus Poribacteria bacterium]
MQYLPLFKCVSLLQSKTIDKLPIVTLKTDKGNINIELYPECAPLTVENFLKLVDSGFYNGLVFHRYVKGFVIQGGDPDGNGTGGPGWTIPGEFQDKALKDKMPKHEKGVIAMARKQTPNSAGSQFYICINDDTNGYTHLDGNYTTFGRVVEGIDIVDNLREGDKMLDVTTNIDEE